MKTFDCSRTKELYEALACIYNEIEEYVGEHVTARRLRDFVQMIQYRNQRIEYIQVDRTMFVPEIKLNCKWI